MKIQGAFSVVQLQALRRSAQASARRRQHRNVHTSYSEKIQRLFNAICADSYIRPHRHTLDPRAESLVAVRGEFAAVTFADSGDVEDVVRFATEAHWRYDARVTVGVELSPETWHTVVALSDTAVLFEVKEGPFVPRTAKEYAPWAPEEGGADAATYLKWLKDQVAVRLSGEKA
jgi:cupin fold WbuC family metalloprotein